MSGTTYHHGLQFYDDDQYLASMVASSLLRDGLGDDRVLIVATAAHREAFASALTTAGIDVRALEANGRAMLVDARTALDHVVVAGRPDRARFIDMFGRTVRQLSGPGGATVRAYGELADLARRDGNPEAAHQIEMLANELCAVLPVTILCGYRLDTLEGDETGAHLLRVCHTHDHLAPPERYSPAIDLRDAVDAAVDVARPAIDAAGQKLTMSVVEEPVIVEGDLRWLTQVVSGLVDNASKYTGRGGHIAVEVESDAEIGEAWVAVSDTGVGMPPERLREVFGRGGPGVGVALARQMAEMHGGRLDARSGGPGRGSRVMFKLPLNTHTR